MLYRERRSFCPAGDDGARDRVRGLEVLPRVDPMAILGPDLLGVEVPVRKQGSIHLRQNGRGGVARRRGGVKNGRSTILQGATTFSHLPSFVT